ncbi:MAG: hypothetical protein Q9164_003723 [Protoblastenia rupestris]
MTPARFSTHSSYDPTDVPPSLNHVQTRIRLYPITKEHRYAMCHCLDPRNEADMRYSDHSALRIRMGGEALVAVAIPRWHKDKYDRRRAGLERVAIKGGTGSYPTLEATRPGYAANTPASPLQPTAATSTSTNVSMFPATDAERGQHLHPSSVGNIASSPSPS